MLQPIVHTHLYLESTLLRSYVYRFKFIDFTFNSARNYYGKPSLRDNQNHVNSVENGNQHKSFIIINSWNNFHFPSSRSLFKTDFVDPNEWTLVYRLKWSLKTIYLVAYGHLFALIGSIFLLYSLLVEGKKFYTKNISDQSFVKPALIFACSLVISFSILIIRSFSLLVLRGYYSPKYQRFMFIRSNILSPWKVRKLIVAPGIIEPIPSRTFGFVQPNFKIKEIKAFIFERNFFYPAYYNVLCGFLPPKNVSDIKYDADEIFRTILKQGV